MASGKAKKKNLDKQEGSKKEKEEGHRLVAEYIDSFCGQA